MIIGIDPGGTKPHALAIYKSGDLVKMFKSSDMIEIEESIKVADKVFIESQYFGGNPSTVIKLAHATGMLMGLCELILVPYEMVYPTTWMSTFGITTRRPKELSAYKWKKKHYQDIIDKAAEVSEITVADEDYGAAILIGLYGVNNDR